jgi:hypothetical protein
MIKKIIFSILLLAAAVSCVKIGRSRGVRERAAIDKLMVPPLAYWSPNIVSIATLGHRSLYEDFLVIWILQILADRQLSTYANGSQVFNAVIPALKQHPRVEAIYLMACFVIGMDLESPKYCEEISRQGLMAFPESWRIPMVQGFIHLFQTGEKDKAAAYYALAATRPTSPDYVKRLAQKTAEKSDATPEDLNQTLETFKEIPGGTKLLEAIRETLSKRVPAPIVPDSTNRSEQEGQP